MIENKGKKMLEVLCEAPLPINTLNNRVQVSLIRLPPTSLFWVMLLVVSYLKKFLLNIRSQRLSMFSSSFRFLH